MRVLVTRPRDDAGETAEQLALRGHEAVIAPLLEIRDCSGPAISLHDVQAILATSSNGVRAFSRRSDRRDLPLYAVGERTASIAQSLGFSDVKSADGDVHALAEAVSARTKAESGALLHVAGAEEPGPLAARLVARGYRVRTAMLYQALPTGRLPADVRDALQAGMLDAVLLFSANSARILVDCITVDNLGPTCNVLVACCISQAAAAPLKLLSFRDVRWAAHPNQTGVLSLLDSFTSGLGTD